MSLTSDIVGMHYRYPDHYVVGREKIREYATAVKNEDASYFDDDAAGRFAPPARGNRADLGALRGGQSAARIADKSSASGTCQA